MENSRGSELGMLGLVYPPEREVAFGYLGENEDDNTVC
jgi:hypothetical protein